MKGQGVRPAAILFYLGLTPSVVGFSNQVRGSRILPAISDPQQIAEGSFSRRSLVQASIASLTLAAGGNVYGNLIGPVRPSNEDWTGTSLPLLSLDGAYQFSLDDPIFPFAQWPDPVLRRTATRLPLPSPGLEYSFLSKIQSVARTLQRTAHQNGAVGLAAQQCGVDVSLVYLQTNKRLVQDEGLFLFNPRIVHRTPEREMLVWTEECLVLPPSFRATLLRDAEVTVEYETIFPTEKGIPALSTQQVSLSGEIGRAVQHEMQHDVGILIVDHVDLDELPPSIQDVEAKEHRDRMAEAFDRSVAKSSLFPPQLTLSESHESWQELLVPKANAAEMNECDDACMAERKRIIEDRRAMMRQSRTNTRRQDVFELSQQRAALYNTTYRGTQCPPGIPCL